MDLVNGLVIIPNKLGAFPEACDLVGDEGVEPEAVFEVIHCVRWKR